MVTLCWYCWEIYCCNNMEMGGVHPILDHFILRIWWVSILKNHGHFQLLHFASWRWNGLKNNLLIPSWSYVSLRTLFLNIVLLSLGMATLPPFGLIYQKDRLECLADFFLIRIVNTYKICKQIAVEAHLFPLDMNGKWPMVSIANIGISMCGICKFFCGYPAMGGYI